MKPINKMTTEEKNREVAEWLGICWHIPNYETGRCVKCDIGLAIIMGTTFCGIKNLDFTTDAGKVQLLREIMNRDTWQLFRYDILLRDDRVIIGYITDTTGKLLDAVLEFSRSAK